MASDTSAVRIEFPCARERSPGRVRAAACVALVLFTGLGTVALWHQAVEVQRRTRQADLSRAVDEVRVRFTTAVRDMAGKAGDADALFAGSEIVSPASFEALAERVRQAGGAPLGLGFAQRVRTPHPVGETEAAVLLHGGEAFGAHTGFDAMRDPERRAALERARDTGRPAVSRRPVLLGGPEVGPEERSSAFVVYSPVYRGGDPGTLAGRRATLTGWMGIPFDPQQILADLEAGLGRPLDLDLNDVVTGVPAPDGVATGGLSDLPAAVARIDLYGVTWPVAIRPRAGFATASFDPRLILGAGLAWTAVTALLGLGLVRAGARSRRHAATDARLRAALSVAPDLIMLVDPDGTILFASDHVAPLLGYAPEDLIGRPAEVLVPERARQRAGFMGLSASLAPTETHSLMAVRADGTEVPVDISLSPREMPDGRTVYAAVVAAIPDAPGTESEDRLLANVAGSTSDAVVTVDLAGWVTSWNAAAERLYEWTAGEAVGRHISFIVPREHHEEAAAVLARARAGESVAGHATVRMRRGGAVVDVSVAESPIRNRSGRIIGVSSVSRDITEERAARKALARYASELERSHRDLEEYATITAHDLSEPLRVVGGYADLLRARYGQGRVLDEAALKYMGSISAEVERMRQLIERVLSFSQLRTHQPDHGPVDLTSVLDGVRVKLHELVQESRAEFFPADLPVVWGDRAQVSLLIENLVSNACKFRHPDRPVRIVVSATPVGQHWAVSVSDNGIGIDPSYHERVFEMFRRLHSSEAIEGAGIGLTLCRQVVNLHGGEITLQSVPGQGSVFTFTLPASPTEAARPETAAEGSGGLRLRAEVPAATPGG